MSPRLTIAEVALALRQSTRYVYGLIERREIGHVREGRKLYVTRMQLETYEASLIVEPREQGVTEIQARTSRSQLRSVPTRPAVASQDDRRRRAEAIARERGWR